MLYVCRSRILSLVLGAVIFSSCGVKFKLNPDDLNTLVTASSSSFLAFLPQGSILNSTLFDLVKSYQNGASGSQGYGLSMADYDGDGKVDSVTTDNNAGRIHVRRNTSTAAVISFGTNLQLVNSSPRGIYSADIDGDGKVDILTTNFFCDLGVHLNTSVVGTISFAGVSTFSMNPGGWSDSVHAADLDGDGKLDAMVTDQTNNVIAVARNTSVVGAVSFAAPQTFATGTSPQDVYAADFDSDGKPDLISSDRGSAQVSVRLNTSVVGTISFAAAQTFATGVNPHRVHAADLDGDGKPEFMTADHGGQQVSYRLNTSSVGSISFGPALTIALGNNGFSVSAADIDGDGKREILASTGASSYGVRIFRNTSSVGSLSFAASYDVPMGVCVHDIHAVDVNGDGLLDVNGSSSSATAHYQVRANHSTIGNISFEITPTIAGNSAFGAYAADFDSDGRKDMVVGDSGTNSLNIYLNSTTNGSYTTAFTSQGSYAGCSNVYGVYADDIDGDGKKDILGACYSSGNVSVRLNTTITTGTITFGASSVFATGGGTSGVFTADVDGDGKKDVLASNATANTVSILRNTSSVGSVSFDVPVNYATSAYPYSVNAADFDGDGKPDLLTVDRNAGLLSVRLNTSTPGVVSFAAVQTFAAPNMPMISNIVDLDGDGKLDISSNDSNNNSVSYRHNTSVVGTISFGAQVTLLAPSSPQWINSGDFDGDGKPDLVAVDSNANTIHIYTNTSIAGSISFASSMADILTISEGSPRVVLTDDFNHDNAPDLVIMNTGVTSRISIISSTP